MLARELFEVNRLSAVFEYHQTRSFPTNLIGIRGISARGISGNFPVKWADWNGISRHGRHFCADTKEPFPNWRVCSRQRAIYEQSHRRPTRREFVIAPDGYTLHDLFLTSRSTKGERRDNQDGTAQHKPLLGRGSETDAKEYRHRSDKTNFFSDTLLSQASDVVHERPRPHPTGNHNGYAQDKTHVGRLEFDERKQALLDFTIMSSNPARQPVFSAGIFRGLVCTMREQGGDLAGRQREELTQRLDDHDNHVLGMLIDGEPPMIPTPAASDKVHAAAARVARRGVEFSFPTWKKRPLVRAALTAGRVASAQLRSVPLKRTHSFSSLWSISQDRAEMPRGRVVGLKSSY